MKKKAKLKLIKYFSRLSIRRKLIITYTLLICVLVSVVGISTYQIAITKLEESEEIRLRTYLENTRSLFDFEMEIYLRKSEAIFTNMIVQQALVRNYSESSIFEITNVYRNEIYNSINPVMQDITNPDIFSEETRRNRDLYTPYAIIYSMNESLPKDGGLIWDYNGIESEEWVKTEKNKEINAFWRSLFYFRDQKYISHNRKLKDFWENQDIALLTIMIPEVRIRYILSAGNEHISASVYLVDKNMEIISFSKNPLIAINEEELINFFSISSENESNRFYHFTYSNENYMLTSTKSINTGWSIVAVYPYSEISDSLKPIRTTTYFILVTGIIISIIVTVLVAKITTGRLEIIMNKLEYLKDNRHAPLQQMEGDDEIAKLDRSINNMISSINSYVDKEKQNELTRLSLQLELLQSKINPHILYNTLSTISWRAKQNGMVDVSQITEKLIRFFRNFLNYGNSISKISMEIKMIEEYIDILKFTYDMKFDTHIHINESMGDYYIIHMLLQPVVENAIIHGLRPINRQGNLTINGYLEKEIFCLEIMDDGVGMSVDTARNIEKGITVSSSGGYGLQNVLRRIKLYYGDEFGLSVSGGQGNGTKISIRLPVVDKQELDKIISSVKSI